MNTAALRELIQHAHQLEERHGYLAALIQPQLERLHPSIRLAGEDASGVLKRFVLAYIERVPEFLDAASSVAREAGIEERIGPVLAVAEQFFLNPPNLLEGHRGFDALLDEAYLAHRLVEEVNDLYIRHFQQPLIPVDTTVANLIAHQLIGETFANQLDEVVHHSVDEMLDDASFAVESVEAYREKLSSPATGEAWKRWPCLSRQLSVELDLEQAAS